MASSIPPDRSRFHPFRAGIRVAMLEGPAIGNTPLVELRGFATRADLPVWAKLESNNPGGSSKDRPAERMVVDALERGLVEPGGTIVESTSGNLGIGLALACRRHNLGLICVVDSRTDPSKAERMRDLGAEVRVVSEPDPNTGDLLTARLALVREIAEREGAHWTDQYSNESNPAAHAQTMREIDDALDGDIDYVFVATSTAGTLCGVCDTLAARRRTTKVIAVDAVGSVLFGGARGTRRLPGFGAGVPTELSKRAWFDRLVRVGDLECVIGCRRLHERDGVYAGASSGGVAMAFEAAAADMATGSRSVLILADGGEGYADTVYSDEWVERELDLVSNETARMVRIGDRHLPAA